MEARYANTWHDLISFAASVLPIEEIASWAHDVGAKVLVDARQSVPHMVVDVKKLGLDFLVASFHKVSSFSVALTSIPTYQLLKLGNYYASDVRPYWHWILIW